MSGRMIRFLAETGMRREEVCGLEWSQVSIRRREVKLTKTRPPARASFLIRRVQTQHIPRPTATTAATQAKHPSMRYRVQHTTRYAYGSPVELAAHMVHLRPRPRPWQTVISERITTDPNPARR